MNEQDITKLNQALQEKNIPKLEDMRDNAEIAMDWDLANASNEAIQAIKNEVDQVKMITASEENSVKNIGGDMTEVDKLTASFKEKVDVTEKKFEEEIKAFENANTFTPPAIIESPVGENPVQAPEHAPLEQPIQTHQVSPVEQTIAVPIKAEQIVSEITLGDSDVSKETQHVQEPVAEVFPENPVPFPPSKTETVVSPEMQAELDRIKQKEEKIKEFDKEIKTLVDQTLSSLPEQLKQLYNSEIYKKLIELNNKRASEEQSLFEAYDKYTSGGDGSHRRVSFDLGESEFSQVQYTADLEFNKAPKELIKRFQEYYDNYKRPAEKIKDEFDSMYNETINKDRWAYENVIRSRSVEVFDGDSSAANNFENKASDYYRSNFNRIKNETIPNQKTDVNTRGTLYSLSQGKK